MRSELDGVVSRAEQLEDLEIRSDLAKYACLRLVGFLEQSIIVCGRALSEKMSSGAALRFAESHLDKGFNPTPGRMVRFVDRFNSQWSQDFKELLDNEETGQAINALVGIRNQIAHGENQGISIERVKDYRVAVERSIDFIVDRFDPLP